MSRRSSRASADTAVDEGEFVLECKAAYLSIMDDITDNIKSKEQLVKVLQQTGRNPTRKSLNRFWLSDTRNVSFDDFVDICRKEPVTTSDDLLKAFRKIDINGDCYISADELLKLMTTKGEKLTVEEVRRMIDEVDENKDGRLDYGEFCNMVISTAEECRKLSIKMLEKKDVKRRRPASRTSELRNADRISMGRKSLTESYHGEEDISLGSQTSLKSADRISMGRKSLTESYHGEDEFPKPVSRNKMRPSSGRSQKLPEPSNLRQWHHVSSKGCFFIEDGSIISHQYCLDITEKTNVWITVQPIKSVGSRDINVDTALYILRKRPDRDGRCLVSFTEHKDNRGKYGVQCELGVGTYQLVPFTTGCHFKARRQDSKADTKLIKQDGDKIAITKAFRKALEDIFDMCDLDGNNRMNRDEFNWFNLRTSGDVVADEEWDVVEERIDLLDGEITKKGFIQLNEMEAEDSEGDTEDLWVTLNSMGFNGDLIPDEACSFIVDIYTEDCDDANLRVTGMESMSVKVEAEVCQSVMDKGSRTKIKGMKDLTMHTYTGPARSTIILDNKSRSSVRIRLDCSGSRNCVSHRGALNAIVDIPSQSTVIGHYLLPQDESTDWNIKCTESILK